MTKTWHVNTGSASRHPHMNGETVAVGEEFSNGGLYPGDPGLGPDETANCQCTLTIEGSAFTRKAPNPDARAAIREHTASGGAQASSNVATPAQRAALDRFIKDSVVKEEVHRGLGFTSRQWDDLFETYTTKGNVLEMGKNTSFTLDPDRIGSYAGGDVAVFFRVRGGTPGADISRWSQYHEELEVLVPKGTRYRVAAAKYKREGGYWNITLEAF